MRKIDWIIRFLEEFSQDCLDESLSWKIEQLIEDNDIEQFVFGQWGMDCLPYDISIRLKKVIIEFFNIFNSYPRFDFYTIQNVDNINKDERFIQWQKTSREIISLAIEHLRKNCDENYNFVE